MKFDLNGLFLDISEQQAEQIAGGNNGNDPNDQVPDFVDEWHGLGNNHVNPNDGDTAADHHNFNDAANPSGNSPRQNAQGGGHTHHG
ncbi:MULTISPECIES: hypothetical protein [unclassified Moorena]|uniref:hypothetical protein n=1 Tax=unclassified Moorena TaxID=2683338 RepID=UPI0013BD20DA|nr:MULTISPECIES: hypothetical protein [unclassified Moorena]NEP33407.1 hypothetical protein [Moorena sp. SIO3B2]NEQ06078.1 hypothetical protein [Moorena sp. SIO4E2]